MNLSEAYKQAVKLTEVRLSESPEYDIYIEINNQLKLMRNNIESHIDPSEEEMNEISIGLISARELEQTDEDYADVLSKLSYLYKHPEVKEIED